jgi:hypothetical protein
MMNRLRLDRWAYRLGGIVRDYPELYQTLSGVYDRLTGGHFSQLRNIIKNTPEELLRYPDEKESAGNVLFYSPRNWFTHLGWEIVTAHILRIHGWHPHFITCNKGMDLCDSYHFSQNRGELCSQCSHNTARFFKLARLEHSRYGDWIHVDEARAETAKLLSGRASVDDLKRLVLDGIPLGELTWLSVVRHLKRVVIKNEDAFSLERFRAFLESAVITFRLAQRALEKDWEAVIVCNGKFFGDAIFFALARQRGLDAFTYERGLREDTILLAKNAFVVDFDVSEIFAKRNRLSEEESARLDRYAQGRMSGKGYVIDYWPKILEDRKAIRSRLHLDENKKIAVAFPNITWDMAVLNREIVFESMFDWLRETIAYYIKHPEAQLVVRIHPAEVRRHFPELPAHIKIVESASPISSYTLIAMAEKTLVYTSTLGLEAALQGKEVVVSARTHYRGKGFTIDPISREEYFRALVAGAGQEADTIRERARRYAYALFFDAHIPFKSVSEKSLGALDFNLRSLPELWSDDFPEAGFFGNFPFAGAKGLLSHKEFKISKSPIGKASGM